MYGNYVYFVIFCFLLILSNDSLRIIPDHKKSIKFINGTEKTYSLQGNHIRKMSLKLYEYPTCKPACNQRIVIRGLFHITYNPHIMICVLYIYFLYIIRNIYV